MNIIKQKHIIIIINLLWYMHTFSDASLTVKTNVENTGSGWHAWSGHASIVAPIGKPNKATDGRRWK